MNHSQVHLRKGTTETHGGRIDEACSCGRRLKSKPMWAFPEA